MTLERSFASDLDPLVGDYELIGPEAHHLAVVRRAKRGDPVELFNGQGLRAAAQIIELNKRRVLCRVESTRQEPQSGDGLVVAVSFPKGERADWLVEKCTELGVQKLAPLLAERSVVEPSESKLERLRRTVIEACKQSGRSWLMKIEAATSWPEAARQGNGGCFLDVQGSVPFQSTATSPPRWAAIGPEGGWTEEERLIAKAENWRSIRLPTDVLRIETAAITVAAWSMLSRPAVDA